MVTPACLSPHDRPQAILLGGQSGAGKTTLHHVFLEMFKKDVIVVNGDEYRKLHPRFFALQSAYGDKAVDYTAQWAGKMVEAIVEALSSAGYNLVIEGTLRTSQVPLATATLLRERGYDVSLALMAVKPEISLVSCQLRYEQMRLAGTTPRATDPAHHRKIVDQIVCNLAVLEDSGMFDQIIPLQPQPRASLSARGTCHGGKPSARGGAFRGLVRGGAEALRFAQGRAREASAQELAREFRPGELSMSYLAYNPKP